MNKLHSKYFMSIISAVLIYIPYIIRRLEDEALNRSRVECIVVGPMSSQQEQPIVQRQIEQQISSLLLSESFSIVGTEVDTGKQIITVV